MVSIADQIGVDECMQPAALREVFVLIIRHRTVTASNTNATTTLKPENRIQCNEPENVLLQWREPKQCLTHKHANKKSRLME